MATILRIKKRSDPYVILDKRFLKNNQLSLKAKGLLAYLLSLPDDWQINVFELTKNFSDGTHAIRATINELEKHGYIKHQFHRKENGKFSHGEYQVYEVPQSDLSHDNNTIFEQNLPYTENQNTAIPQFDFPYSDNPHTEKPDSENRTLLNKEYTKYRSYKIKTAAKANATVVNFCTASQPSTDQQSAAALFLTQNDEKISTELTITQYRYLKQEVKKIVDHGNRFNELTLLKGIEITLLDPKSFDKSNQIFLKKLNAIINTIQKGNWIPPQPPRLEQISNYQQLRQELRNISGEVSHFKRFSNFTEKDQENIIMQQLKQKYEEKFSKLTSYETKYRALWYEYIKSNEFSPINPIQGELS